MFLESQESLQLEIRNITLDVDGTFLTRDPNIFLNGIFPSELPDLIIDATKRGITTNIATNRSLNFINTLNMRMDRCFDPGTWILEDGLIVRSQDNAIICLLKDEEIQKGKMLQQQIQNLLYPNGKEGEWNEYGPKNIWCYPEALQCAMSIHIRNYPPSMSRQPREEDNQLINDVLAWLKQTLSQFSLIENAYNTGNRNMYIPFGSQANKAVTLRRFYPDARTGIYAGDGINDIEALSQCKFPVVVQDAKTEVLTLASKNNWRITSKPNGAGIVDLYKQILGYL